MARRCIWLGVALFSLALSFSASAQVPIVYELGMSVLRGLMSGIGARAGQEIYDSVRGTPQQSSPQPSPPTTGRAPSGYSVGEPMPPLIPPDGLEWKFLNQHGDDVSLQLYSANRRYQWPGTNRAYRIPRGSPQTLRVRCTPGERVCFGAWALPAGWQPGQGYRYWGTGPGRRHSCIRCCQICGSQMAVRLN